MKKILLISVLVLYLSGCTSSPESLSEPELFSTDEVYGKDVSLTGLAFPRATVKVYSDGELISSTQADRKGQFSFNFNSLSEGQNSLVFSQTFKGIQSVDSQPITVNVDLTPPSDELSVDGGVPGYVKDDFLTLTGNAEPNTHLLVNSHFQFDIDGEGRFSAKIPLVNGANTISLALVDGVGNKTDSLLTQTVVKDTTLPTFTNFGTSLCRVQRSSNGDLTSLVLSEGQERVCLTTGQFYGPWEGYASAPVTGVVLGDVVSVKLDGKNINWREDGNVNQRVSLYVRQGMNNFDIEVTDKAGNVGYGTFSVSWGNANEDSSSDYEDRIDDLESRIEDLE